MGNVYESVQNPPPAKLSRIGKIDSTKWRTPSSEPLNDRETRQVLKVKKLPDPVFIH